MCYCIVYPVLLISPNISSYYYYFDKYCVYIQRKY